MDVDDAAAAELLRAPGHGAAVVAVGGGGEAEIAQMVADGGGFELGDGEFAVADAEALAEKLVEREGAAEDLEGVQAEALGLVLDPDAADAEHVGEPGQALEGAHAVAFELAVELAGDAGDAGRQEAVEGRAAARAVGAAVGQPGEGLVGCIHAGSGPGGGEKPGRGFAPGREFARAGGMDQVVDVKTVEEVAEFGFGEEMMGHMPVEAVGADAGVGFDFGAGEALGVLDGDDGQKQAPAGPQDAADFAGGLGYIGEAPVLEDVIADDGIEEVVGVGQAGHFAALQVDAGRQAAENGQGLGGGVAAEHLESAVDQGGGVAPGAAAEVQDAGMAPAFKSRHGLQDARRVLRLDNALGAVDGIPIVHVHLSQSNGQ